MTRSSAVPASAFVGFRFPSDVILLAVRWYLRYNLSYRDLEELLAERGVEVDHVTLFRWVQRFTPLLAEAARPCRHLVGDRWFVDETYVKVGGAWRYVYRALDQHGQVIDVMVSKTRDIAAATSSSPEPSATTAARDRSRPTSPHRCSTSSTTCCLKPSTTPASTPTTGRCAITAGSKRDYDGCAGSRPTRRPQS